MNSQDKAKDLINTFYYALPNNGSQEGINSTTRRYEEAKQCALIAEEFAIGFAEWFWINKNNFFKGERDWYLGFNQILEIYKKEKGL